MFQHAGYAGNVVARMAFARPASTSAAPSTPKLRRVRAMRGPAASECGGRLRRPRREWPAQGPTHGAWRTRGARRPRPDSRRRRATRPLPHGQQVPAASGAASIVVAGRATARSACGATRPSPRPGWFIARTPHRRRPAWAGVGAEHAELESRTPECPADPASPWSPTRSIQVPYAQIRSRPIPTCRPRPVARAAGASGVAAAARCERLRRPPGRAAAGSRCPPLVLKEAPR